MTKTVITAGAFDNMDSRKIRFLHEASKSGKLSVALFDDDLAAQINAKRPDFPLTERKYFVENIRYVDRVCTVNSIAQLRDIKSLVDGNVDLWNLRKSEISKLEKYVDMQEIECAVIDDNALQDFPEHDYDIAPAADKKVIVTGCFDWFHSGHIRFFEEASPYGDLYVILGHDKNIEKLKGVGHPMFCEDKRKYIAGSIRFVKRALLSSGDGWLDAEPEIQQIKPDRYIVNEDGDKEIKRRYCRQNSIEYVVLKRKPRPGLKPRTSTGLRGF